jgi:hypothetical protein
VKEQAQNNTPADTDHEVHLRLSRDVEVAGCTGSTLQADLLLLLGKVALHVRFRTLEDDLALRFTRLAEICQNSTSRVVI